MTRLKKNPAHRVGNNFIWYQTRCFVSNVLPIMLPSSHTHHKKMKSYAKSYKTEINNFLFSFDQLLLPNGTTINLTVRPLFFSQLLKKVFFYYSVPM